MHCENQFDYFCIWKSTHVWILNFCLKANAEIQTNMHLKEIELKQNKNGWENYFEYNFSGKKFTKQLIWIVIENNKYNYIRT